MNTPDERGRVVHFIPRSSTGAAASAGAKHWCIFSFMLMLLPRHQCGQHCEAAYKHTSAKLLRHYSWFAQIDGTNGIVLLRPLRKESQG